MTTCCRDDGLHEDFPSRFFGTVVVGFELTLVGWDLVLIGAAEGASLDLRMAVAGLFSVVAVAIDFEDKVSPW